MFPVGVILLSLGYAVAYKGLVVLRWVHDPSHPHGQPPSLPFLLGASSTPYSAPFAAPINTEGATDPFAPFGASGGQDGSSGGAAPAASPSGGQSAPAAASSTGGGGGFFNWLIHGNLNPNASN